MKDMVLHDVSNGKVKIMSLLNIYSNDPSNFRWGRIISRATKKKSGTTAVYTTSIKIVRIDWIYMNRTAHGLFNYENVKNENVLS